MDTITHSDLVALMSYDPDTGIMRWREYKYPRREDRAVGFTHLEGYVCTKIKRRTYKLHRLAWFYVHAEWPPDQVDHINGDRADNRIANLRLATQSQNRTNAAVNRDNRLGIRGVRRQANNHRYEARITHAGKQIFLGRFLTVEEAVAARTAAETRFHKEFAATGRRDRRHQTSPPAAIRSFSEIVEE